jgi:hypothetical protein
VQVVDRALGVRLRPFLRAERRSSLEGMYELLPPGSSFDLAVDARRHLDSCLVPLEGGSCSRQMSGA